METNNTESRTKMMIETTSGLKEARTHNLVSESPKEIVAFIKKSGLTAGFCLAVAVNRNTGEVYSLCKDGYFNQADVKPFIEHGCTEWLYSWAFSGKTFDVPGHGLRKSVDVSKMRLETVEAWSRAFGVL
jgi:hypothetical protein